MRTAGYIAYEASPTMALPSSRVKVLSALASSRRYGLRRQGTGRLSGPYRSSLDRIERLQGRIREIGAQVAVLPEHLQADVNERLQTLIGISNQTVQYISRGLTSQADATLSDLETELASFETYLATLDPSDVTARRPARRSTEILSTATPQQGAASTGMPWGWIVGGVAVVGGLLLWLELK
jgi:hypothetical protein